MEVILNIGDLIIDIKNESAGVLVERYDIFTTAYAYSDYRSPDDDYDPVWAWRILWTNAPHSIEDYTEFGLLKLVENGVFKLQKHGDQ